MAGRLYRMAKVVSANPKSWGIVDANEISGFKRVAKLADLYSIAECILSSSYGDGVTDGADAVGQIWHVSETNGDYKLTNWASRKSAAGWTKLSYGGDVSVPVKDVQVNDKTVLNNGVAKIDLTDYATQNSVREILTHYMTADAVQSAIGNVQKNVDSIGNQIGNKTGDGIATLKDGKIPLDQLANLDTTVYKVLGTNEALPTTGIKSCIYLKLIETGNPTGDNNKYAEYVYTGNIKDTYDATKWEKLGEVAAKTDLSDYYKKSEVYNNTEINTKVEGLTRTLSSQDINDFTIIPSSRGVQGGDKEYYMQASITRKGADPLNATIPCVVSAADTTNANAGLMSPADKKKLDTVQENANAYTHPTRSAEASGSEGLYKITVNDLGHVSKTTAVKNADIDPLVTVKSNVEEQDGYPVSGDAVNTFVNSYVVNTKNMNNNGGKVPNGMYTIPIIDSDKISNEGKADLQYEETAIIMTSEDGDITLQMNDSTFWSDNNLTALTDVELTKILV